MTSGSLAFLEYLANPSDEGTPDDRSTSRSRGAETRLQLDSGERTVAAIEQQHLIAQLRSDDIAVARAAFEALFRAHYADLVRFAVQYVGTVAAAEDVVCEWFSRVWVTRDTVAPRGSFAAYAFGAVRHRAISMHRSMQRSARRRDPAQAPLLAADEYWGMGAQVKAPDHTVLTDDRAAVVWQAVAELPERQREVLVLRWQVGKGWDEIAAIVGTTSAAVQMQHSRAIKVLRERLRDVLA